MSPRSYFKFGLKKHKIERFFEAGEWNSAVEAQRRKIEGKTGILAVIHSTLFDAPSPSAYSIYQLSLQDHELEIHLMNKRVLESLGTSAKENKVDLVSLRMSIEESKADLKSLRTAAEERKVDLVSLQASVGQSEETLNSLRTAAEDSKVDLVSLRTSV